MSKYTKPKTLILDIETSYMTYRAWSPKLNSNFLQKKQMIEDWSVLAWAAKWRGKPKIHYEDTRNQKNKRDDSKILIPLFELMNEADIIVGKNSDRFDIPKINARFLINNINKRQPPDGYKKQDVQKMCKPFGFSYKSLEYVGEVLNLKHQKMVKRQFEGLDLWIECIEKDNPKAWAEMKKYNPLDILATEELYEIVSPWSNKINPNVYHKMHDNICMCGSNNIKENGKDYQKNGVFQRYKCVDCGHPYTDKQNELSQKKRNGMLK
jgi:DNA polymerase elongation subunit (family B)